MNNLKEDQKLKLRQIICDLDVGAIILAKAELSLAI